MSKLIEEGVEIHLVEDTGTTELHTFVEEQTKTCPNQVCCKKRNSVLNYAIAFCVIII